MVCSSLVQHAHTHTCRGREKSGKELSNAFYYILSVGCFSSFVSPSLFYVIAHILNTTANKCIVCVRVAVRCACIVYIVLYVVYGKPQHITVHLFNFRFIISAM